MSIFFKWVETWPPTSDKPHPSQVFTSTPGNSSQSCDRSFLQKLGVDIDEKELLKIPNGYYVRFEMNMSGTLELWTNIMKFICYIYPMGPMGSNLQCFIYIGSVDFYDKCTVGKCNIHGSYGLMFSCKPSIWGRWPTTSRRFYRKSVWIETDQGVHHSYVLSSYYLLANWDLLIYPSPKVSGA